MGSRVVWAITAFLIFLTARALVASFPYSGESTPPMYGDYEAQRHWMEITLHLPITEWYQNTTRNDLLYWGLDYPPLSAYHSYLIGQALHYIEPESVALFTSRGYESVWNKCLMRLSVIVSDLTIYAPAVCYFLSTYHGSRKLFSSWNQFFFLSLTLLLQPGQIVIDHGHFQYNGVSLGLCLLSVALCLQQQFLWAVVFYSLAIQFKIIALYFAPAFLFYFVSRQVHQRKPICWGIVKLFLVWAVVTGVCWFPFVHEEGLAQQVLRRCFPVGRGLYEDRVANFWCLVSPVFKLKQWETSQALQVCLAATIAGLVLPSVFLLRGIGRRSLVLALASCALSFFLFSFHVHEKTILFPLLPLGLLAMDYPRLVCSFTLVALASMLPLLFREGLLMALVALGLAYSLLFRLNQTHATSSDIPAWLAMLVSGSLIPLSAFYLVVPSPDHLPAFSSMPLMTYCTCIFLATKFYLDILLWREASRSLHKRKST